MYTVVFLNSTHFLDHFPNVHCSSDVVETQTLLIPSQVPEAV